MYKKSVVTALSTLAVMGSVVQNASALNTGDVLEFDAGVYGCLLGGTYPNCNYGITDVTSGSYFAVDFDGNGFITQHEKIAIAPGPDSGIIIGTLQPASGSHAGCPNGTENPKIDMPWCFFGNTGMHQTQGIPVTDNGDGTLDFSGWGFTWNGIPNIYLGGDKVNFPDTGKATIVCATDPCVAGVPYTLEYEAHIPVGDPSGFGGVLYYLYLEKSSGIPQPVVSLDVDGGLVQECSAVGGSNVTINLNATIPPGDTVESIMWLIDGAEVVAGYSVEKFLALGSHTIKVTLITTNGGIGNASAVINVQDTTKPELTLGFIDVLTGKPITEILHSRVHNVSVNLVVNDVCDANPSSQGTLIPLMKAAHGDIIKVFGSTGEVEMPITAIQLTGTATDAKGNYASGQSILTVKPD